MVKSFTSTNTDLPYFYQLIKTHKINQGIKIRPIISYTNGPTKKISWLPSNILRPMLRQVRARLHESSMELIDRIRRNDDTVNWAFPYPSSLDVVMYTNTSVRNQEAIRNATELMAPNTTTFWLTASDVDKLLSTFLSNTYFSFQSSIYLQHQGLPMGSSLSGYLAILFMNKIEKATLTQYQRLNTYKRYEDDIFFQTKDEEHANTFHLLMSQQHPIRNWKTNDHVYLKASLWSH